MGEELVSTGTAAVVMVVLGIVMGFSPIMYGITLYQLNRHEHAGHRVVWLAAGLGTGALVLLIAFRAFNPGALTEALRGMARAVLVQQWVDVVAGVLFLLAAAAEGIRSLRPHQPPRSKETEQDRTPRSLFAFGLVSAGLSTNRLLVTYATGRVAATATHVVLFQFVLYLVFITALIAPYLLSAWAWKRFPRASEKVHGWFQALIAWDARPWVAAALTLIGVGFLYVAFFGMPRPF